MAAESEKEIPAYTGPSAEGGATRISHHPGGVSLRWRRSPGVDATCYWATEITTAFKVAFWL